MNERPDLPHDPLCTYRLSKEVAECSCNKDTRIEKASNKEIRDALVEILVDATIHGQWRGNPFASESISTAFLVLNKGTVVNGNRYDLPKPVSEIQDAR